MTTSYYTLLALNDAWRDDLIGCVLADAFSQQRDELTLALTTPDQDQDTEGREWMLRISVRGGQHFVFRSEGYNRAKRNTATLFEEALGATIAAIRLADRDRMFWLDLSDGRSLQIALFGPKANIFLIDADGQILEAFRNDADLSGTTAPTSRPARMPQTFEAFEARWRTDRKTLDRTVTAAFPLFDRTLAREVIHRSGVTEQPASQLNEKERRKLFEIGHALEQQLLEAPAPHLYWRDRFVEAYALTPLAEYVHLRKEVFETVDAAVQIFVRRRLGEQHFRRLYEPLERALAAAAERDRQRADRMLEELSQPSRADRYERWGHLLMAAPAAALADQITLPDLFAEGQPEVTIPLDDRLTLIENAQRYYAKAKATQTARAHAEMRMVTYAERADQAAELLQQLRQLTALRDVQAFRKTHAAALAQFAGDRVSEADRIPFRRFPLGQGYEVWVGRNARQNDDLTLHYAQKYDLWMHARGVPGSHAVLRLPSRTAQPPTPILEQAASIAAYYSKLQGSQLVPVMVTPRKYIRKPRGAAPGQVKVERERVLLVEPGLPQTSPR
ncbi:MAG: NFACT RNA binding domain-containing protein [Bacteroidota bacterium]